MNVIRRPECVEIIPAEGEAVKLPAQLLGDGICTALEARVLARAAVDHADNFCMCMSYCFAERNTCNLASYLWKQYRIHLDTPAELSRLFYIDREDLRAGIVHMLGLLRRSVGLFAKLKRIAEPAGNAAPPWHVPAVAVPKLAALFRYASICTCRVPEHSANLIIEVRLPISVHTGLF